MRIRLNQELPPRFVAALGLSFLIVLSSVFVLFLIDSCRDWVPIFFVKQVARIHVHQGTKWPYLDLLPPYESVRYDPIDHKYIVTYGTRSTGTTQVLIYSDGRVWIPPPPSH